MVSDMSFTIRGFKSEASAAAVVLLLLFGGYLLLIFFCIILERRAAFFRFSGLSGSLGLTTLVGPSSNPRASAFVALSCCSRFRGDFMSAK